jgi:type I restriction enzyme, S subunit
LPIVRIQNLNNPDAPFNFCDESDLKEQHIINDKQFLISWSGTPGTSFGAFIWNRGKAALNQHIFKCFQIGKPFLDTFLMRAINNRLDFLISQAQGAVGLKHVTKGTLENMLLPLPPLSEQTRIIAKIDQLMARCDELEKLRAEREQKRLAVHTAVIKQLLDAEEQDSFTSAWQFITRNFGELYTVKKNVAELRKAILQLAVMGKLSRQAHEDEPVEYLLSRVQKERQAFELQKVTEPVGSPMPLGYEIPINWKWQCLDDLLVSGPTNGFSPRPVDYETQVRSLTLSATTSGTFNGEYSKFIDIEIPLDSDLWLRDGDILVQRGNTLEYVGVPAVYRGSSRQFIYPDLMMKLRLSAAIDTDYVYYAMSSEPCRDYLRSRASGTSGTMPKINQNTLKSLPLPIPPVEEQRRIVTKIKQLMALCNILEHQIDATTSKQIELLNAVMVQV